MVESASTDRQTDDFRTVSDEVVVGQTGAIKVEERRTYMHKWHSVKVKTLSLI